MTKRPWPLRVICPELHRAVGWGQDTAACQEFFRSQRAFVTKASPIRQDGTLSSVVGDAGGWLKVRLHPEVAPGDRRGCPCSARSRPPVLSIGALGAGPLGLGLRAAVMHLRLFFGGGGAPLAGQA